MMGEVHVPTPSERLEIRRQLIECRVCAWLATLDDKTRGGWAQAIANPRFGATLVASLICEDQQAMSGSEFPYDGPSIGESSIDTHRRKAHR